MSDERRPALTAGLHRCGIPGAPLMLLLADEGEGEAVWAALQSAGAVCDLGVIDGFDWNRDLSPWPAPAVFRDGEAFSGGADATLAMICEKILPALESQLPEQPAWRGLAGYSLAGLTAVYAMYRTDCFERVMSASGSLWYPGFEKYAVANGLKSPVRRLYLSLGDRESHTRNPVMRTVEDATLRLADTWRGVGIRTCFEFNPGNHFEDPLGRIARGILWLVKQ